MDSSAEPIVDALPVEPRPAAALTPVAEPERVELLDVLRGIAVFGILLVNIGAYAHPMEVRMLPPAAGDWASSAALWFTRFFAEGKFYPLFSMLFGLGLAVQSSRAEQAGRAFGKFYTRRLVVLAAIGLVHGLLIWPGDILLTYAILGFGLLAMRNVRSRRVVISAALFLLVPALLFMSIATLVSITLQVGAGSEEFQKRAAEMKADALASQAAYLGSYAEIAARRATDWLGGQAQNLGAMPSIFAMFLIGLWAGRRRVPAEVSANRSLLARTAIAALLIGLPAAAMYASFMGSMLDLLTDPWTPLAASSNLLFGPILSLGYAATIALVFERPAARRVLHVFAPAGRMALTNYLTHSVVCTFLFYGYGLGWFGRTTMAQGFAIAVALFSVQLVFSRYWLAQYRFGPVEWAWRSLTYGALQPMRRPVVVASPMT